MEGKIEILTNQSQIILDKIKKKFSFQMKNDGGEASGYADLSDDEFEVFENVFTRMANNVIRQD